MQVEQIDNGEEGKFFILLDGNQEAEMTYVWFGEDRIIINHTEASDKLQGQGAGKLMVSQAVEFARNKKIKIVPLCPFAKAVIDKEISFHDIL